ncbi:MAG: hypothetical protein JWL85_848 [Candidatus Saccharibacteria bacterium]|nr:hypothetical protein [Candidatus Saccharibacteria bacterium]
MTKDLATTNDAYFATIQNLLETAQDEADLHDQIVNAPFHDKLASTLLSIGIITFMLVCKKSGMIDRIGMSDTELAKGAINMSIKPLESIRIPIRYDDNLIAKAINKGIPQITQDWQYLFNPVLTPEEARFNQAGAGIGCSFVYPLAARDGAALIFSYYQPLSVIGSEQRDFMQRYSELVARTL